MLAVGVGRAPAFNRPALLRRLSDGRPDRSFGRAGTAKLGHANDVRYGTFRAVSVLADGRLVAAGAADGRLLVARFTAAGRVDRTFGTRGVLILPGTRRERRETAVSMSVQADQSLLISGEGRRPLNEYYDEVRMLVTRVGPGGTVLRREVGRRELEVNGSVVGHVALSDGAWLIGDRADGRVALARTDRRGRLRGGAASLQVLRRLSADGGSIAGGAPLSGGGVLIAGTLYRDVEISFPSGRRTTDRGETPVLASFGADATRVSAGCPDEPTLPAGAWAAEFTSVTAVYGGLLVTGWTRPPREDDEHDEAFRLPTSPIVFRALTP